MEKFYILIYSFLNNADACEQNVYSTNLHVHLYEKLKKKKIELGWSKHSVFFFFVFSFWLFFL